MSCKTDAHSTAKGVGGGSGVPTDALGISSSIPRDSVIKYLNNMKQLKPEQYHQLAEITCEIYKLDEEKDDYPDSYAINDYLDDVRRETGSPLNVKHEVHLEKAISILWDMDHINHEKVKCAMTEAGENAYEEYLDEQHRFGDWHDEAQTVAERNEGLGSQWN